MRRHQTVVCLRHLLLPLDDTHNAFAGRFVVTVAADTAWHCWVSHYTPLGCLTRAHCRSTTVFWFCRSVAICWFGSCLDVHYGSLCFMSSPTYPDYYRAYARLTDYRSHTTTTPPHHRVLTPAFDFLMRFAPVTFAFRFAPPPPLLPLAFYGGLPQN